ncbi:MAG: electron transfer flavoprotein subunit beta/FixA family protein [Coriobacteriales bacterium]|jgi:electron transfer flavoprotein beta subunit
MMNVMVCVKAVPSTTEVKMDPVTKTIVRDGRQSVINPFDASALEVAVRIKERLGATVGVMSMGIPDTQRILRDCLARGADFGVLLSDRPFAGADTLATSYALMRGIDKVRARWAEQGSGDLSLVVCGKMAVDGDTAQIGPELARQLGFACVTSVCEVLEATEGALRVLREVDGGHEEVRVSLPALITVTKDVCNPRMPSITGVRFGMQGPVDVWGAADVGADPGRIGLTGSPTQVVRSFTPERATGSTPIEGDAHEQARAIVDIIKEMA